MSDEKAAIVPPAISGGLLGRLRASPLSGRLDRLRDYAIVVSVAILALVLALTSDVFLTKTNIINVLDQIAPIGIIACALTYVLISGEFDLSAGAISVVTGVIAAKLAASAGFAPAPALLLGTAIAAGFGLLNGLLVAYARINSFVSTLASALMIGGLSLVITQGFLIAVPDPGFRDLGSGKLLGINYSILLFAVVAFVLGGVLSGSKYGRWLFAVGGNREAARLSGINTRAVVLGTFVISGLAAGIAGALIASRTAQGQAGDGIDMVLFAFAAVVVGGTSIMGGRGAIWRTVLGVLLLGLISNGFNLHGVDPVYQQIVQGAIIMIAVAADALTRTDTPAH